MELTVKEKKTNMFLHRVIRKRLASYKRNNFSDENKKFILEVLPLIEERRIKAYSELPEKVKDFINEKLEEVNQGGFVKGDNQFFLTGSLTNGRYLLKIDENETIKKYRQIVMGKTENVYSDIDIVITGELPIGLPKIKGFEFFNRETLKRPFDYDTLILIE